MIKAGSGSQTAPGLAVSSQLIQLPRQLLVRQLSPLRPRHQFLRLGHGGVPIVCADLASLLSDLQAVVGLVVLPSGRSAAGAALGLFAVGAYLAAGALGLAGGDVVAVAGVVPGGQEEVASAVMAAAGCIMGTKLTSRGKLCRKSSWNSWAPTESTWA